MIMPAPKPNQASTHACQGANQQMHASHRDATQGANQQMHAPAKASNLHLESAAADLVSKPTTRLSMGTKIPPPPTPPTVPNAEPRNPTTVATTTRQLNARSWERERERAGKHRPDPDG